MLDPGDRRAGTPRLTEVGGDRRIVGQTRGRLEPAETARQRPEGRSLGPADQPRAGDLSVSVALAQLHQDLSIVMHLESPATHRLLPDRKGPRVAAIVSCSRYPRSTRQWLLYGESCLALICMPKIPWLHYAEK